MENIMQDTGYRILDAGCQILDVKV